MHFRLPLAEIILVIVAHVVAATVLTWGWEPGRCRKCGFMMRQNEAQEWVCDTGECSNAQ